MDSDDPASVFLGDRPVLSTVVINCSFFSCSSRLGPLTITLAELWSASTQFTGFLAFTCMQNISSSEHISNISNAERINLDKLNAQIWHLAQYTSVSINITIAPRHMFVSWQSSSSTPMKVSLYSCGTSKCANCGEENSSLMACLWHSLVATKSRRHIRMWPRRKLSTVPHFSATALTQWLK